MTYGALTTLVVLDVTQWGSLIVDFGLEVRSVLCQIDEEKEARKKERARLLLAGHSMAEDDDPFEGLTPQVRTVARTAQ